MTTPQEIQHINGKSGEVTHFQPEKAGRRDEAANAAIRYAKRVHDWPMLEKAIEQKIEDQRQFLAWWEGAVTPNQKFDRGNRSVTTVAQAEKQTGITKMQVSRWRKRLEKPDEYQAFLYGIAWAKAMAEKAEGAHVANNSGENEWYTPSEIIEAARSVLGGFDLDPASSEIANQAVGAARIFTVQDDGLKQEWPTGRIWMNPPYAQPLIGQFSDRFAAEIQRGSTGIVLVNNATETAWFQTLTEFCSAICFPKGRVRFVDPNGNPSGAPLQGQAIIYCGQDPSGFASAFQPFGLIVFRAGL